MYTALLARLPTYLSPVWESVAVLVGRPEPRDKLSALFVWLSFLFGDLLGLVTQLQCQEGGQCEELIGGGCLLSHSGGPQPITPQTSHFY